jgi:hypothetical protein
MGDQIACCHRSHANGSIRVYRKALYRNTGLLFEQEEESEEESEEEVEEEDKLREEEKEVAVAGE